MSRKYAIEFDGHFANCDHLKINDMTIEQIKADAIEEFANIVLTEMEYGVGGSIENFIIEYVEQTKEQK